MTKRTVAFIDILGFKSIVETSTADELGLRFTNVIGKSLSSLNRKLGDFPDEPTLFPNFTRDQSYCINFAFSDSIILVSKDESEESCLALLIFALRVSQILIGNRFPVRGAITYGDMYVDLARSLFLGKAMTSAYELEQRQNWIGLVIDDSIPETFQSVLVDETPTPGLRVISFQQM